MATESDIIDLAFRRIQVGGVGESITGHDYAYAASLLASLFAETEREVDVAWTLTTVPEVSKVALANLLAVELAPTYSRPLPEAKSVALTRYLGTVRADNRDDYRDLDDDDTISESEEIIGDEAKYY